MKNQRLIALFVLGCVLFNFPIIALFNQKILIQGVPLIYIYVLLVWGGFIALAALIVNRSR